jgi:hypothetical protein
MKRLLAFVVLIVGPSSAGAAASPGSAQPPAVAAFQSAWAGVASYSTTITAFERKGSATQSVVFKYTFRKPSTVTIDMLAGPGHGVSLLWTGGTGVIAHEGGLLAIFKRTLPLHDPAILTLRGSSIDELSFGRIIAHALQTPGTIVQSTQSVDGSPATVLTLTPADPSTDRGYTRESIELSNANHLPFRILGYEGATLVRKIDIGDLKLTQ